MSKATEIILFIVLYIGLDFLTKWIVTRIIKQFHIQIRHKYIWYGIVFVIAVAGVIAVDAAFPQIGGSMISIGIILGIVTGVLHAIRDEVVSKNIEENDI